MAAAAESSRYEHQRRQAIRSAAAVFAEKGFHGASTRDIAERMGIKQGSLYYYFKSKELLLQAFYHELNIEIEAAVEPVLPGSTDLAERLRLVMLARLDVIEPYHRFCALLFRSAADPSSPLNPFHETGQEIRGQGEALFDRVVQGSKAKVPANKNMATPPRDKNAS